MEEALLDLLPGAPVYHLGLYRYVPLLLFILLAALHLAPPLRPSPSMSAVSVTIVSFLTISP